jgi:hypothetical protein
MIAKTFAPFSGVQPFAIMVESHRRGRGRLVSGLGVGQLPSG